MVIKRQRKLLSLILSILVGLNLMFAGLAPAAAEGAKTFDFVEITDFHGNLTASATLNGAPITQQRAGVLAKAIKDIKASNPDTIVLSGGDMFQGTPVSNVLKGKPVIDMMSNIGFDAMALGNHEYDWGTATVIDSTYATLKGTTIPVLAANVYDKTTGQPVDYAKPYVMLEKDGVKIGIIGVVDNNVFPTSIMPALIANVDFKNPTPIVNNLAAELRAQGAKIVVVLAHMGAYTDKTSGNTTGALADLTNNVTGVDAIFGGHTHSLVTTKINGIPVGIANSSGYGYIDLKLTVGSDGTVSAGDMVYTDNYNLYNTATPVVDNDVKAIVDKANADIGPMFDEAIATADADITRTQSAAPYGDSALGNWTAEVTRQVANADFGTGNNGGLRIDLPKGDITIGTMYTLMPFDNTLVTVKMTGAQVKTMLEQAVKDGGKGISIAGLSFTYDPNMPSMHRVVSMKKADGTPVDLTKTYTVASNNFMGTGGDGFAIFADPSVAKTFTDTFKNVRDVFIDAAKAQKTITAAVDNRIAPVSTDATVTVLGTSDIHGNIFPWNYNTAAAANVGLAKVSTYVNQVRAKNPNAMLIDNGDLIQGTPLSYYFDKVDTKSEYPLMKAMGVMKYDTFTPGNHEYNYGLDVLNRVIADAKKENISVISANTYKDDGSNFVDPYYIKTLSTPKGDVKVGILGLTNQCIPNWEDKAHYAGLTFNDVVTEAKKWVPQVRAAGADVVILTAHTGENAPSTLPGEDQINQIATQVSGIDAILAGHTHAKITEHDYTNPDGQTVIVTEPGNNGMAVSRIDIGLTKGSDGKWTVVDKASDMISMTDSIAADSNVTSALQSYQDATLAYVGTKIGTATGDFLGTDQMTQETALMDLINKTQMEYAKSDLSIAAPLSSSAKILQGDITIQDLMGVYVYENFLYGIKMTGKQLKDWMEYSVRYYSQVNSPTDPITKDGNLKIADYNLDQLYGATYTIDLTQPACTLDANGKVISGNRIKNLKVDGKLVKDTDEFTVAINNYRYNGGGGFMAAAGITNPVTTFDSAKSYGDDGQVRNLMQKYIQEKGTISPTVDNFWTISKTLVAETKAFDFVEVTDFHGNLTASATLNGAPITQQRGAVLAKAIKDIKASNPDTIVLAGGDMFQGTPVSNVLRGKPVIDMMTNIGFDAMALGNHEYDWGTDAVIDNTSGAALKGTAIPVLAANVYDKTTGNPASYTKPYVMLEKDGVKIGIIGVVDNNVFPTSIMPALIANVDFRDPAPIVNDLAAQLRSQGAQVVVVLAHMGAYTDKTSGNTTGALADLANNVTGVDAIFGGHTHSQVNTKINNIPVGVANSNGYGYIDLKLTVDSDGKVTAGNIVYMDNYALYNTATPAVDTEVQAIVDKANADIGPMFDEVIATADIDLTRTQSARPYGDSILGNWTAEVTRQAGKADIGLANNGGLRIDVPKGPVTVGTMYTLMPFDNTLVTIKMTGAQIKTMLEQAVKDGGKGIQESGVTFSYDPKLPNMDRVFNIKLVDGTPLNMKTTYTVATSDFVGTGGDGFDIFKDPAVAKNYTNTFKLIREVLIQTAKDQKTITAAVDNRIARVVSDAAVTVIATSDMHGNIFPWDYNNAKTANVGLAKISTYVNSVRANSDAMVLVDNGDTIQGTPLSYYYDKVDITSEYPMMKAMGIMQYDTWTLGNHEYNYGLDVLNRIIGDAGKENIKVLSANTYKDDGSNFVDPYYIKTLSTPKGDVKVGILGLTTKTIPNWEDKAHYAGLTFNDLVDEATKWVPQVRAAGADVVILVAHTGEEGTADAIPENQIKAIATHVNGIDAIVAGHTHAKIAENDYTNPAGQTVIVTEPGSTGANVSRVDIGIFKDADGKWTVVDKVSDMIPMTSSIAADPDVISALQSYQDATLAYVGTKIGTATGDFLGTDQMVKETALMDLINKTQMEYAKSDLSIAAPLSASAKILQGDITIQDLMRVYVYENFLYGIKMNGKQLKDWMEYSVRYYSQVSSPTDPIKKDGNLNIADYNLDQLCGATYTIDLTQPACTLDANGKVISGNRIKNLKVHGKLVKDTDQFTVAINNYRYNGGGGFMAAAGITNPVTTFDSAKSYGDDGQVRNLMQKYIQEKGTISPTVDNFWTISKTTVTQETEPQEPTNDDTPYTGPTTTQPTTTPTSNIHDGIAVIPATVDSNGNAAVAVTTAQITDLLKSMGGKTPEIEINVDSAAKEVDLTIPKDALKAINDSGANEVVIDAGIGEVSFDKTAIAAINSSNADISLTVAKVDRASLPSAVQNSVGNHPVFDFAIRAGNTTVSSFNGGNVTIVLPYILAAGEDPNAIVIYYIDSNGQLSTVNLSEANISDGKVSFVTTHFSKYAVGYNKVNFTDTADNWSKDNITYLAARNIVGGVGNDTFAPGKIITRAEFAKILAGIIGADVSGYTGSKFSDVPADAWYAPYVAWAAEKGIAKGSGDGSFNPNAPISREEMAVMITRFADIVKYKLPSIVTPSSFADSSSISSWAVNAVSAVQAAGIISGKPNKVFDPKAGATRAEAAKMLTILIKGMVE